jgi:hypothetical protein
MPRRKWTEEEIDDWREQGFARIHWLATHPEEAAREHEAHALKVQKRWRARVKKHQPVVVDISFNGDCTNPLRGNPVVTTVLATGGPQESACARERKASSTQPSLLGTGREPEDPLF